MQEYVCVAQSQTLCLCVLSILCCALSRVKLSSPRCFPQLQCPKIDLTTKRRGDEMREVKKEKRRDLNVRGGKARKMSRGVETRGV